MLLPQLCPHEYCDDTTNILGDILPHDDSVNDRTEGSKLCNSQVVTETLWKGKPTVYTELVAYDKRNRQHTFRPNWFIKLMLPFQIRSLTARFTEQVLCTGGLRPMESYCQ